MKFYFCKNLLKPIHLIFFVVALFPWNDDFLNAEYLSENQLIDSSTKLEEDSSALPTNPFEIVEMIRRKNSFNDATNPSDALDEALKSFYSLEDK